MFFTLLHVLPSCVWAFSVLILWVFLREREVVCVCFIAISAAVTVDPSFIVHFVLKPSASIHFQVRRVLFSLMIETFGSLDDLETKHALHLTSVSTTLPEPLFLGEEENHVLEECNSLTFWFADLLRILASLFTNPEECVTFTHLCVKTVLW